jgi:hypothetical protein
VLDLGMVAFFRWNDVEGKGIRLLKGVIKLFRFLQHHAEKLSAMRGAEEAWESLRNMVAVLTEEGINGTLRHLTQAAHSEPPS